jgi:D-3-phosphoglycerate dehydrogenase
VARIVRADRELEMPRVDAALRDAELLLMCYTPVTARVIESAGKLKGIVKYGVGIDAIDFAAASQRGIPVVNVPEYAEETVAEGAFALLLALAKKLKPIQRAMDREGWMSSAASRSRARAIP